MLAESPENYEFSSAKFYLTEIDKFGILSY
jgi:hypothetical protein